jgi:restriction endonuclease Mrr
MQQEREENSDQQATTRAIPGSILPEREYWLPILEVIEQLGGSAAASDVIEALEGRMKGMLKLRDYEKLSMGEIRWRNRARFARLRMTERGLLSKESHRGIWEITDTGRRYLEAEKD